MSSPSRSSAPALAATASRASGLWRFYVDFAFHGQGVAQALMTAVEDAARARGASTLWLGVWESNVRAQAFYRKQGFTVVGSQIFILGSDPQRDLIMAKTI
jgi:ribosomal protein S18 acetylase RimI-like enzyme